LELTRNLIDIDNLSQFLDIKPGSLDRKLIGDGDMRFIAKLAITTSLLVGLASAAQATTYNINRTVGAGTVSGFFETDGTLGAIVQANVIDWSLTIQAADINGGAATSSTFGGGGILTFFSLPTVVATASDLLFNFSGAGSLFTYTTSGDYWCVAGNNGDCFNPSAETIGYSPNPATNSNPNSGLASFASNNVSAVPLPAALPLLAAAIGALGVAGSRRKRNVKAKAA
jgi:hypothetical protein